MIGKLITLFRLKQGDFSSSAAGCDLSTSLLEAITNLWICDPTVGIARSAGGLWISDPNVREESLTAFDPAELRSRRKRAILSSARWDRPFSLARCSSCLELFLLRGP